jgi:hypothetical protein
MTKADGRMLRLELCMRPAEADDDVQALARRVHVKDNGVV